MKITVTEKMHHNYYDLCTFSCVLVFLIGWYFPIHHNVNSLKYSVMELHSEIWKLGLQTNDNRCKQIM
jgi:hypothetical protein